MKRDMSVIRQILLQIEERPNGTMLEIQPIDGIEDSVLHGHVELLVQAGYLKATDETAFGMQYTQYLIEGITFEGHEFLDTIRHSGVWNKLKAKAEEEGGNLPFTVIKKLGAQYLNKHFGLDE